MLKDLKFQNFNFNNRKEILLGVDVAGEHIVKIQLVKNSRKEHTVKGEYEVMKYLNDKQCVTCPKVIEYGTITKEQMLSMISCEEQRAHIVDDCYEYNLQQYIPDDEGVALPDIVLAVLEQKKLGVFQADIKPANLRFDSSKSLCYIIDYDQAIYLTEEQKNLPNDKFFEFCSVYDKDKHGIGNWLRHLQDYDQSDLDKLFRNNSFDLGKTTIIKEQKTTNSASGIYHTIESSDIFADGSRKVDVRAAMLNKLDFKDGERVLDIGCNTGLLCQYLNSRGCSTTGVDNDTRVVIAAKIVANILGKDINYHHLDLDQADDLEEYDTIMLFSVLHHTRDVVRNAKKIANACDRIIIEARLVENGAQPHDGEWIRTSAWSFETWQEFYHFCERIFPGFKFEKNLGLGSKNRNICEFVKQ